MPKKTRTNSGGSEWEKLLAAYDDDCRTREREFQGHHIVINDKTDERLTEEENVILNHLLSGVTCEDMAQELGIETQDVIGVVEVIRTKLIIED